MDSESKSEATNVNNQLEQYMDSFDPADAEVTVFDPIMFIAAMGDKLSDASKDYFVCERLAVCKCKWKSTCKCDSDDFHQVSKITFNTGSNCNCVLDLEVVRMPKFNPKRIIRVFSLDKKNRCGM